MNKAVGLLGLVVGCGKGLPHLDCSNIISAEVRAKYFANYTLLDETMGPGVGQCKVIAKSGDTNDTGRLTVNCVGKHDVAAEVAEERDGRTDLEDVPGVGRAALISRMFMNDTFVRAWDDNSKCSVSMFLQNNIDAVALAKDVLAYYPTK